ncbi:MAG: HD-GYP domain-containing protein [Halarsenatibacteraceae bacterium]
MRLVKVDNLENEMELAKPIYNKNQCLLTAGQKNLNQYKDKFQELDINYLYIEDQFSYDIELNDVVSKNIRKKGIQLTNKIYSNLLEDKDIDNQDIQEVKVFLSNMIDEILANTKIMMNMIDIKNKDNYTFAHSVNVTVLSVLLGNKIGLNRLQLEKLALGSICHDLGKSGIPEEILKKPDKLTEEEYNIIQEHPRIGFERLRELNEITPTSLAIVLGHHEKLDGSGYPRGIKADDIHLFPRITAIADVYDALSSDRIYRDRWPIDKTLSLIYNERGVHFDSELVNEFISIMPFYPNGCQVQLNDGRQAVVVSQNKGKPSQPNIRILDSGRKWQGKIDLTTTPSLKTQQELI